MGVKSIRFPETSSIGIKPVSREGSERLIRQAILFALKRNLPSVTLVHKGNIMKYTEGAFMKWGYALAEREFGNKVFTWNQHKKISAREGRSCSKRSTEEAEAEGKLLSRM